MLRTKKIIFSFYLLLVGALLSLAIFLFFERGPANLEFYVFNIGQGDSILIRTPSRYNILIDGGPDNGVVYKLGKYLPFYDRQIDLMVLTHPHADHLVGLIEVLKRYQVKNIFLTGVAYDSADYQFWLSEIIAKNVKTEIINQPKRLALSDGVELIVLYPDENFFDQPVKNLNNSSVVIKLIYQNVSIMMPGDLEIEESLVAKNFDLSAAILKAGHHGSANANGWEFLKAVNPDYAVISAGIDNKFGHPHQLTLERLKDLEIEILRTDWQGDIYFVSDGQKIWQSDNLSLTPLKKN